MNGEKFLVLSDTHGNIPALMAVLSWAKGHAFDTAVFLGDGISDLDYAQAATGFSCIWKRIRGNNDWDSSEPETDVLDFGGRRFFLCHGHRYGLYGGYHLLIAAARKTQADAALFGHIHVPVLKNADGLLLVNPGSVGRPRNEAGAAFAVIECLPKMPLQVQFWHIGNDGNIQKNSLGPY